MFFLLLFHLLVLLFGIVCYLSYPIFLLGFLFVTIFSVFVLSGKRYFHQIEMISVIKMEKGRWSAAGRAGCYHFAYVLFFNLSWKIW